MSSTLKSLNFTTLQKPSIDPTLDRRIRVIARLEEQKLLLADPNYKRTVRACGCACSRCLLDRIWNEGCHWKNLWSDRASAERPHLVNVADDVAQADYVVERILENREAGITLKSQAVLFRASHHSASLEVELTRRNIPFVKFRRAKIPRGCSHQGRSGRPALGAESSRSRRRVPRCTTVAGHRSEFGSTSSRSHGR
jgi:hypothetical protein